MSDLDLSPILARVRAASDPRVFETQIDDATDARADVPALVDEVRKLRAIVKRVEETIAASEYPGVSLIDPRVLRTALVDQCHHIDGEAECWHFGDRDGRDG